MNKKYDDLPPVSDPNYQRLYRAKHRAKLIAYNKQKYADSKEERLKSDKAYREANPWKHRERIWKRQGIKDFNWSDYLRLLEEQNHRCKICQRQIETLQADHNHLTGKVRGLLCSRCNTLVGHIENNQSILKEVYEYIYETDTRHNCHIEELCIH